MKTNCGRSSCLNKDCDECFEIANKDWYSKNKINMTIITQKRYAIPAYGKCDLCAKDAYLNRVYNNYPADVTCECHSPHHFDIYDVCSDCVVEIPTNEEAQVVIDNLAKDRKFYMTKPSRS